MARPAKPKTEYNLMYVTPDLAENWLAEANQGNRNLRPRRVESLARDMRNNVWSHTHEGLAFDENGRLVDGQHRLSAIVSSDRAQWLWVCNKLEVDAALYLDDGARRSLADAAKFDNGTNIVRKAEAVARSMHDPMATSSATRLELYAYYRKHAEAIHFAVETFAGCKLANAKIMALVARAWYTQDHVRLAQFAEVLRTGITQKNGDKAAIKLRDQLMIQTQGAATDRRWLYRRACYCLAKFLACDSRVGKKTVSGKTVFLVPGETGYRKFAKQYT